MHIERIWAMPNKWTFTILPIKKLLLEEMGEGVWVDPFAGFHSPAQITNDLNPKSIALYHMDALEFLKQQSNESFDGGIFDPPYSPSQVKECYAGFGLEITADATKMSFWSNIKDELARILKTNGKVICCGWNSMGLGKNRGFQMNRILLVPHGGSKNDTIVTVEKKL